MKRRRHRRGLGFSPVEHEDRAVGAAINVHRYAGDAEKAATQQHCAVAFDALSRAHEWKGRLTSEIQGGNTEMVKRREGAEAALHEARMAFWKNCARRER